MHHDENLYQQVDAWGEKGGWIAAVLLPRDQDYSERDWPKTSSAWRQIGIYGTRSAAVEALKATREVKF